MKHHRNRRTVVTLSLAATALVAAACTKPPLGPSYEEYVARWVKATEVDLVSAWGIPEKSHPLENGGRILEYTMREGSEILCTTRYTIDQSGIIVKYWYRGTKCRAPKGE